MRSYALAFGSLLLVGGRLGDMFSRKWIFIIGLIGFALASALVNTGQQVGGSIGVSVLSTIAASATASYLVVHHTGPQAAAIAATHGYTLAFTISASLLGLGAILAVLMLPSHRRLKELVREDPILVATPPPAVTDTAAPAPQRRQ